MDRLSHISGEAEPNIPKQSGGTYTQSELALIINTIDHFRPALLLLGFKGSSSPPSHLTSKGSFSTGAAPASASPPPPVWASLSISSHPYPLLDLDRLNTRREFVGFRGWELERLLDFEHGPEIGENRLVGGESVHSESSVGREDLSSYVSSISFASFASGIMMLGSVLRFVGREDRGSGVQRSFTRSNDML